MTIFIIQIYKFKEVKFINIIFKLCNFVDIILQQMSENLKDLITVTKSLTSKIQDVDFKDLSFGNIFSDHMLICDFKNGSWKTPKIVPYQSITLDPSSKIFHYGQSIFEGLKAYKDSNHNIFLFRPDENAKRFNISAKRLAIPELPESFFIEGLKKLLEIDKKWIPNSPGSSLYIRPFIFASSQGFHASPANEYKFIVATSPSGPYFSGKVKVLIEEIFSRSANGGVGYAKAGGNYAGQFFPTQLATAKGYDQVIWTDDTSHEYIEEAGAMNIFVRINDTLITVPTNDRILDGITRKSILEIAKDEGIEVEVRKVSVAEIIEAYEKGSLKEMFGTGTAAVISPISTFGFRDIDYQIPEIEKSFARLLKKRITDIQTNISDDKFGWRIKV